MLLWRPSVASMQDLLENESPCQFSYSEVGATANTTSHDRIRLAGYDVDHVRVKLGHGQAVFDAAKAAIQRWEQFHLGWIQVWPVNASIQPGEVVLIVAHTGIGWWLNPCRIVYVIDESGPINRYGFANGTLPSHVESGEERFLIEWNLSDQSVWYDILAFSRPNHFWAGSDIRLFVEFKSDSRATQSHPC